MEERSNRLTYDDRKQLEALYNAGVKITALATAMNVHRVTIYRELRRGNTHEMDENGRFGYSAKLAQQYICESNARHGRRKATQE